MVASSSMFLKVGELEFELSGLVSDEQFGPHLKGGNFE